MSPKFGTRGYVAPFTGAWIEIGSGRQNPEPEGVAPFTGAWIEMRMKISTCRNHTSRSLHGSVD